MAEYSQSSKRPTPETRPELADTGQEKLEEPFEIKIDPENLLESIIPQLKRCPEGLTVFRFDRETNTMTSTVQNRQIGWGEHDGNEIAISKHGETTYLSQFWGYPPEQGSQINTLIFQLDERPEDRMIHFDGGRNSPNGDLHVHFGLNGDSISYSNAWMTIQSHEPSAEYFGNGKSLFFIGELNVDNEPNYTPRQLGFIFQGGTAPTIDIQDVIFKTIFLNDGYAVGHRLAKPTLAYDHRKYGGTGSGIAARALSAEKAKLEPGEIIEGVIFYDPKNKITHPDVYKLRVTLKSVNEIDREYSHGTGKALQIKGDVLLDNGKVDPEHRQLEFTIFSGREFAESNPQYITAYAFKAYAEDFHARI